MFRKLFKEHGARDVITLFHAPSSTPSVRILALLKQANAATVATATEDQASSHTPPDSTARTEFELDVTEDVPTPDQLKSILEYIGPLNVGSIVEGARSETDAVRKLKERPESFKRPLVVDWNMGRVVVGENQSEILSLLKQLHKDSDKT